MDDQSYFNAIGAGLAVAVLVVFFGGMMFHASAAAAPTPAAAGPAYLNLTILMNPQNGMPQYSPANFSVPAGIVVVTITDQDMPVGWAGCICNVTGTVGNQELVNGTPYSDVPSANVAHTFTVPGLGINVLSPAQSVVTFTLDLTQPGTYTWYCQMPCGASGYTGAPMGESGYMTGTMVVL